MRPVTPFIRSLYALVLTGGLYACGGGDEYNGFDATVSQSTPDQFLKFFNRQGDLAAGSYTLVVATDVAGQAGSFSVSIRRNDGSDTQLIDGSWVSSGGLDSSPDCASGNRCFGISLKDARGATFVLTTALDGVLYLVDSSGTAQVVASAGANGPGRAVTLKFSESEIDETRFASAYYEAIDPMGARATAQEFIALHGLNKPDVHVIFRDSKDLGYGRDMYMVSYDNASKGSTCGPAGAVTTVFYVRNFSVQIVEGFAYGPVNLEAAIAEDLQHHVGTNAIEFGYGRDDIGEPCSPEPMAKFFTYAPVYDSPNAPHPLRLRVDLDDRGAKAMPQPCISCHGGKLRPLDRFGRFVAMHANDDENQIGDTKARMQAFEVDTFEFSDQPGHRRSDYEEGLRRLNAAIYCTYPGSQGHAACAPYGNGIAAQADEGEWSGDFGREMMLGWYRNRLETPGTRFSDSYVPPGWRPSAGGPPGGADTLFRKVVGPNCFVCHGKRGNELGTENNAGLDGKDLDFRSWDKFISHADEIERLVFDEGRMPMGLLNYQNFWGDPEKSELLASFLQPYVSNPDEFEDRRTDSDGNIILPGSRVVARAGPDRVTRPNSRITLNAQASLFADTYRWDLVSSPAGSSVSISKPSSMRTDFRADIVGEYVLRLTASSSETGSSSRDTLSVVVDGTLTIAPRDLAFYPDISVPLDTCATACHSSTGIAGVPVWWVADNLQPAGSGTGIPMTSANTPALGFYEQVMTRVNLEVIEDSLILKKPSGAHHYGGQQAIDMGFDIARDVGDFDRRNYDRFVNWIAEGAACGGTADECIR